MAPTLRNTTLGPVTDPGTFETIGQHGLLAFSGIVTEDFLKDFHGKEAYKRFNEMRLNSPVIGGLLLAIENSVRPIKYQWTNGEKPGKAVDPRIQLLNDATAAMSHTMADHVSEVLTMLPFGFAPFAIWYQRDEKARILWRRFLMLGQNTVFRWDLDDEGGIQGFWQLAPPHYQIEYIPIERMLLYRTRVEKNNPEGRSILRPSWIPYYFAKNIQQNEAIGIERDLCGLPEIDLPATVDTTESPDDPNTDIGRANMLVRNVRQDQAAGIVLPAGWAFKLVTSGGSKQFDTDKVITRYNTMILQSSLTQFLMLGTKGSASLALSKDQTDFFTMTINVVADIICNVQTHYAAPRLLALNGMDCDGIQLEHSPSTDTDLAVMADFLQKVGVYIDWTPEDQVWLRQLGKLPERTAEEIQQIKDDKQARALAIARATPPAPPAQPGQQPPPTQQPPDKPAPNGKEPDNAQMDKPQAQLAAEVRDVLGRVRKALGQR